MVEDVNRRQNVLSPPCAARALGKTLQRLPRGRCFTSRSCSALAVLGTLTRHMHAAAAAVEPGKRKYRDVSVHSEESSDEQGGGPRASDDAQAAVVVECMECLIMKDLSCFSSRVRRSIAHHHCDAGSPSRRTAWVCKGCTSLKCGPTVKRCCACGSECKAGRTCSSTQAKKPATVRLCSGCQKKKRAP